MAPKNDEEGFVVRDKRGRGADEPAPAGPTANAAPHAEPAAHDHDPAHDHQHPPVTFATFVFSLSTSALMLMGEQLDPRQGKIPVNLPQAKEIIDILSVLETKTKGNLDKEEQAMLTDMLYALRMKYVDVASGKKSPSAS